MARCALDYLPGVDRKAETRFGFVGVAGTQDGVRETRLVRRIGKMLRLEAKTAAVSVVLALAAQRAI